VKTDTDKIKRMIRFYLEEILPGNMDMKIMVQRFGLSVGGIKYNLKKAGVWRGK
jgi:hypothetical protein